MPKVVVNVKAMSAPGEQESHYGYVCTVGPERQLFAEVPEDLIQIELAHGRVTLVEVAPPAPPAGQPPSPAAVPPVDDGFNYAACEDLEALKSYATAKGIPFHYNAGLENIKAKIAEAEKA